MNRKEKGPSEFNPAAPFLALAQLADQGLDYTLDQPRLGVDAVEVAVAVIIAVAGVQIVLAAPVDRHLVIGPAAIVSVPALADVVMLLGDAGGQAAVMLLGEARRTAVRTPEIR